VIVLHDVESLSTQEAAEIASIGQAACIKHACGVRIVIGDEALVFPGS
jgi:hypothetical protein